MAETTENYGLLKPEETDYYSIEIQNKNMDAIDAALKVQAEGIATKASADGLTAHTSNTAVHVTTQEKVAWDGKADSAALTAHTGDTGIHVNAAKQTMWNNKANGNSATWVATAVTDPDSNNSSRLTIPNFVFTEGCQVTFKAITKPISNNPWFSLLCGGVWYAVRDSRGNLLDEDAWIVGANVTVTLTAQSFNPPQAGWRTAFFKGGAGEKITYTVYCQPTAPSAQSGIWLKIPSEVKYKRILMDSNPWSAGSWKPNSGVSTTSSGLSASSRLMKATECQGILYHKSGYSSPNKLVRLQLSNNTWMSPLDMPSGFHLMALSYASLVNLGNELYSFYFSDGDDSPDTYFSAKYTPSTSMFSFRANPPRWQSTTAGAVVHNENAYLFSNAISQTTGGYFRYTHRYNRTTDSWTELATRPGGNHNSDEGCCLLGGNIYKTQSSSSSPRTLLRYTISSNSWTTIPYDDIVTNYAQSACTVGDEVFLSGGGSLTNPGFMHAFRPSNNTWRSLPDMPRNRSGHSLVLYGSLLYCCGGSYSGMVYTAVTTDVYSLASKIYSEDPTVVVYEVAGDMNFRASLISSKMLTWAPTWFKDAFLFQAGQLTKPELYYRNGHTSWQKIRNAQ